MIYVVTLVYGPPKTMRESLERFDATIGLRHDDYQHIFLDQHWPKDRDGVDGFLEWRKSKGGLILDAGKNLGISGGINFVMQMANFDKEDIIIFYDPDMFPIEERWGWAFKNVMHDKSVGWVSTWNHAIDAELKEKPHHFKKIGDYECAIVGAPVCNSCCALRASFLIGSGGAHEPRPYYGGFEANMWGYLQEQKLDWAFVRGFNERHIYEYRPDLVDEDYKTYKWETTRPGATQPEFAEWLKNRSST